MEGLEYRKASRVELRDQTELLRRACSELDERHEETRALLREDQAALEVAGQWCKDTFATIKTWETTMETLAQMQDQMIAAAADRTVLHGRVDGECERLNETLEQQSAHGLR